MRGGHDVVGIDEVQFFDASIVGARARRLPTAASGSSSRASTRTSAGCRSGSMPELLAYAEFVDKLQAVCHRCGGTATTTQRLVDGRPAPYSGETIVVGALDSYEARCRDCHEAGRTQ